MFPNPNNGQVNILSKNENELIRVRIMDVTGKIVYAKNISGTSYNLDISDLKSSMYFMEI
nr:T9SS type A sorting domain-containing protein [Aurantibacillus circumpalustris]